MPKSSNPSLACTDGICENNALELYEARGAGERVRKPGMGGFPHANSSPVPHHCARLATLPEYIYRLIFPMQHLSVLSTCEC